MTVKRADSKGRITLGSAYANATLLVEEQQGGAVVTLRRATTVPVNEAWLYQNTKALDLVNRGLEDAKNRSFSSSPPNLDRNTSWVEDLED
jgi:hypothetical protein